MYTRWWGIVGTPDVDEIVVCGRASLHNGRTVNRDIVNYTPEISYTHIVKTIDKITDKT